jgi:hypothetical protein
VVIGTIGAGPGSLSISLNANATPEAVQALVRNVTYENTSDNPATHARSVRFELTDGDGGTSPFLTHTVNVMAVNDAPVVTLTGAALAYTENDGAVAVDPGLTLTDADSANLTGATVRIFSGFVSS